MPDHPAPLRPGSSLAGRLEAAGLSADGTQSSPSRPRRAGCSSTRRCPRASRYVNDVVGKRNTPSAYRRGAGRRLPQARGGRESRPHQGAGLPLRRPVGSHHLHRRRPTPPDKQSILDRYEKEAEKAESQFKRGIITDDERRQKEIEIWTSANSEVGRAMEPSSRHCRSTPGHDGGLRVPEGTRSRSVRSPA